ncbi:MAG: hypothetical protein LBR41_02665 [Rickettsiales bacterium]|jgi:methyl-accepting chemotaxis protein|nr:hypothetical protein [Rickettsiales bacterium]
MTQTTLFILIAVFGAAFLIVAAVLFFVSRKSQQVMESLLMLLTKPERAKVADAARVLRIIMADEIDKINANFVSMQETLNLQIMAAETLKNDLGARNEALVNLADSATKNMSDVSARLDETVGGLRDVVESKSWSEVSDATQNFSSRVNELLNKIEVTSAGATERTATLQSQIENWIESGKILSEQLQSDAEKNVASMNLIGSESHLTATKLGELAASVADGFTGIKTAAADYETVIADHDKKLKSGLEKMDTFTKQSKTLLNTQMNTLTNTANVVGGQIRLSESSLEKQVRKLTDAVESLMASAAATEGSVRNVSAELTALTNRFNSDIKEYTTSVVGDLQTVSGVANTTLENTRTAAGAFGDSVRAMASGVRETLMEMNTAHQQLSSQSEQLIKMSSDTTAQLQPLSELIEKYYTALPELSAGSTEIAANMEGMIKTMTESIAGITDASAKLETLSGQSRQQMIDLMADYAKATETMQSLNKQMAVARATAPMEAIKAAPAPTYARISSADFMKHAEKLIDKLHEQSMDLTRAAGAEIPDAVWKKYHAGDKTIFSKWLAKMLAAADKKQVRSLLKSDAVFRAQAMPFVRGFDKMLAAAEQTDNRDAVVAALLKTDLGVVYGALKGGCVKI